TNGVVPLSVTFTDNSTGTINTRSWDFGDGATSNTTLTTLAHTYTLAGTNSVRLIVTGPLGVSTNLQSNAIVGINPAQQIVTPGSRDFGSVTLGTSNSLSFSVINAGDVALHGTATVGAPFT